ncbi:MAG: NadR, partial [Oligoflexus sp.]|nr:NadR [Pseudopedobacter sp.]
TVKIWSDYQLGETPQPVLDAIKSHKNDFYILLKNDLPWQEDSLRDFKGMGDYFLDVWHKELKVINANYQEVGGQENRLQNSINAIDAYLFSLNL